MGSEADGRIVTDELVALDERPKTSCALSARPGDVLLAWTGSDYRINTLASRDGRSFGAKQTLSDRSGKTAFARTGTNVNPFGNTSTSSRPLPPALAVGSRGRCLAWTGTDGRLNVRHLETADGARVLGQRSSCPPALATWRDGLALAWTGTDTRLNLVRTAGADFGQPLTLDQSSGHGPALAGIGGELALAWIGTDARLNVAVSEGGHFGRPLVLEQKSYDAPALAVLGGDLVLGWTGTDGQLNLLKVDPGPARATGAAAAVGPPSILAASASSAPALCASDGSLLIAWTDTDRGLNVARLQLR